MPRAPSDGAFKSALTVEKSFRTTTSGSARGSERRVSREYRVIFGFVRGEPYHLFRYADEQAFALKNGVWDQASNGACSSAFLFAAQYAFIRRCCSFLCFAVSVLFLRMGFASLSGFPVTYAGHCLVDSWEGARDALGRLRILIPLERVHFRRPSPRARNSRAAWNQSSSGDPSGQPRACHSV
jgi:hypothetical protein